MKPSEKLFLEQNQSQELGVQARGASRKPRDRGRAPGGGRALLSPDLLEASLACTPSLQDHVHSKNHAPEGFIPFGLL